MDRYLEACLAAERIIDMIESAGFDITNPYSIINYANYNTMPDDMQYSYGASRLVIWDDDYCDYVIKIALDEKYEKFCQHEVEVYGAACKEGLEKEFAWCMCYSNPVQYEGYVPGIYVMEYVDCNEDAVSDAAWTHGYEEYCNQHGLDSSNYDAADDFNDWHQGETEEMVLDYMESLMAPEYRRAFEIFMCKWWITDIHEQNVGFKGNKMVITDYAGWNW